MSQKFLQLEAQESLRRSRLILDEIEELVEKLPNSWKTRYTNASMNLEIAVKGLFNFIHLSNIWRKERKHLTDEEFYKIKLPKSNVLCDAQGNFYDK